MKLMPVLNRWKSLLRSMTLLKLSGISKFKEGATVLKEISFALPRFQRLAIAGATGSGKTTLLKIIAGLVQPDSGEVCFENARLTGPNEQLIPGHPAIAYLSQHFELRNNYRVEELLAYADKLLPGEAEILFGICRISHLLKRRTDQLSGGEKQRIALTRLLVSSPTLLLLDEPFSNLDFFHKQLMKSVIEDITEQLKITCMLVSHDPLDILSWAEKVIIINNGELVQQGTPVQVYRQPADEYSAALSGSYNLIPASIINQFPELSGKAIRGTDVIIRPENVRVSVKANDGLKAVVVKLLFLGSNYKLEMDMAGTPITALSEHGNFSKGDFVYVSFLFPVN